MLVVLLSFKKKFSSNIERKHDVGGKGESWRLWGTERSHIGRYLIARCDMMDLEICRV